LTILVADMNCEFRAGVDGSMEKWAGRFKHPAEKRNAVDVVTTLPMKCGLKHVLDREKIKLKFLS
jgi:hypothetical protein